EPKSSTYYQQLLESACRHFGIRMDLPYEELPSEHVQILMFGSEGEKIQFRYENEFGQVREAVVPFEGVIPNLQRRHLET
ncbi:hypothetical protein ABTC18_20245, partial [Acinetobacter baumannii]